MENQTPLEKFVNSKKDWQDRHIQLSILYEIQQLKAITEKNRSNTSKLVWWLIFIPIIFGFLMMLSCSENEKEGCPCETIRGYEIENCSGKDYSTASDEQLQAAENLSDCN